MRRMGIMMFVCFIFVSPLIIYAFPDANDDFYVLDQENILSEAQREEMIIKSEDLYEKTTIQLVTVIIDSFDGADSSLYVLQLFNRWGVGDADTNNGILCVTALKDRITDCRVGLNAEGFYSAGYLGATMDRVMIPLMKEDKTAEGIFALHDTLYEKGIKDFDPSKSYKVIKVPNITPEIKYPNTGGSSSDESTALIAILALLIGIPLSFFGKGSSGSSSSRGSSSWSSSSSRSSSSRSNSGGGGRSDGGGARRSW